jgi:glycosyltransferase involved in cell wall biosynthesis
MYSVVILTLNEEKALPSCLASLKSCTDIVVLDSGSSDGTVALAKEAGARVFTRKFDNFAGQRNFAQKQIEFRNNWVLHLDADERMTPDLDAECIEASARDDLDGFLISPKMMFQGRWVRHCTDYPAYQARLVRAPAFEFIQVGHGQRESATMRVEKLNKSYLHDMSIYGVDNWIEKHRRYARAEAARLVLEQSEGPEKATDILVKTGIERRRALKRLSFRLPFRPFFRFVYQFILRRGFLDGRQGLGYCLLLSRYEGFIADEIASLRRQKSFGHTSQ